MDKNKNYYNQQTVITHKKCTLITQWAWANVPKVDPPTN